MLLTSATNSSRPMGWLFLLGFASLVTAITIVGTTRVQSQGRQALTLRADLQQANTKTGVVIAKGNVQLSYPARQIQATATQAQYSSREHRLVLSGNVYVLHAGNSLRADTVTYLIDEGRFVALPRGKQQVEAVILIPGEDMPPRTN